MPFLDETQLQPTGFPPRQENVPEPDYEFWSEVIPAAFRQENSLWSTWTNGNFNLAEQEASRDPNFDPLANIPENHKLYASRYAYADNEQDVVRIGEQIDRELTDRQLLNDSGGDGILAAFIAGVLDPINLIPVGGAAYRSYKVGSGVLKAGATVGAVGGVSAAIQEGALHSTQETRTPIESAINVTGATFLSALLGAGAAKLTKTSADVYGLPPEQLVTKIENEFDKSAGAAEVGRPLEEEGIASNAAVDLLLNKLGMSRLDPIGRTITSMSVNARRAVQKLAEIPETLTKNVLGEASPETVFRGVQNYKADMSNALLEMDDLYVNYVKGRNKKFGDIATIGAKRMVGMGDTTKMTYREFRTEIGKAMRRGDVHDIPEVAKAAQMFRSKVFEPLKKAAVDRGLLPEDVEVSTAVSYLNRVYDIEKLSTKAGYDEFIRRTTAWLQTKVDTAIAKVEDAAEEITKRDEYYADLTKDELISIAQDIAHQITGSPIGRLPSDGSSMGVKVRRPGVTSTSAKQLKTRSFLIPDEMIEDFLESDIEILASHYVRSMAPDVELARIFNDDGNLTNTFKTIQEEWSNMKDKPSDWDKQMKNDLRDLAAMRDRIKGIYAIPEDPTSVFHRTTAGLRKLNFVTLLGGMTISAIPDLARPVMVNGIKGMFGDLIVPMLKNFKAVKLAAREMKDLGASMEYVMSSRAASLADVADETARYTKVERALGAVADTFGAVSLMGPWNGALKQIAGITSSQRFIRALKAEVKGTISKKERTFLRQSGISEDMSQSILKQIETYGFDEDGLTITRWGDWDNPEAARIWRSAINRQMDQIILTPGEEIPLTASGGGMAGELGRMALQFKRFAFAANHRMLISGLQQSDAAFVNGLLLSVVLGAMVSHIKATGAGQDTGKWDATKWVVEGIDRSGVTGVFMDVNNIAEKVSRGHIGLSALTEEQASRYASRNVVGALVGPSFGTASQIMSAAGNAVEASMGEGEWSESDVHTIRRLLPYQNLFYTRKLFDMAEENMNQAIGAKP